MAGLHQEHIIVSDSDMQRLRAVLDVHQSLASDDLDAELHRAQVVPHESMPADVVTMDRDVVYEDADTLVRRRVRLVYPHQSDPKRGWVSVLAPIGSALLGLRVGQCIEWSLPTGRKRVRIVEVH
jgi:regulator of nucleoside diphosphate kinase